MAAIDIWIQLEPHAWDVCPTSNVDRITGETINPSPQPRTLTSPVTGVTRTRTMRKPLADDALILRRYTENWAVPDDRKVNPWDLNEPDPTDNGTMGTIPGPVIACNVGDSVTVHFRNMDDRNRLVTKIIKITLPFIGEIEFPIQALEPLPAERRTHSLHPHGFVFAPTSDGAYPLTPPDPGQPIPAGEAAAWSELGVTGLKQGDRVPPHGTFTYTWETLGWPTTAGVWLYHDHSICDMDNVNAGAIGLIVIHNPADTENEVDITPERLPGGSVVGSPVEVHCFPFDIDLPTLPNDLTRLGDLQVADTPAHHGGGPHGDPAPGLDAGVEALLPTPGEHGDHEPEDEEGPAMEMEAEGHHPEKHGPPLVVERAVRRGDLILELDDKLERFRRLCFRRYRTPPDQGLYLQLFHEMPGVGMVINGRKYMGNTPTIVAGPSTRMRFGVVGMGNSFHTFHLHGHRWVIPGPTGTTLGDIQGSAQNSPVSQFEDTRVLGPANSFAFTIEEGNGFMRAAPPFGEWHMHCHVLGHMMDGMMGSLLIVHGGEFVTPLPVGTHCPPLSPEDGHDGMGDGGMGDGGMGPKTWDVNITGFAFSPATVTIKVGDSVKWTNNDVDVHTATADGGSFDTGVINRVATGPPPTSATKAFNSAGTFPYHCNIHTSMKGTVVVNP